MSTSASSFKLFSGNKLLCHQQNHFNKINLIVIANIILRKCQLRWFQLLVLVFGKRCYQGWAPRPAGRGGSPPRPALWGGGGFPAPPRKNDQNRGEVAGQNECPNLNFSNRGNKWWNNITTLNNAQSSLSIGYARESKTWKYLLIFLLTGHQTLFSKICQHMK